MVNPACANIGWMTADQGKALLIAVSARYLPDAAEICRRDGAVALPVLEAGDLTSCEPGMPVFVLAAGKGDAESRSVGWRASLVSWSRDRPDVATPGSVDAPGEPDQRSPEDELTAEPGDDDEWDELERRPAPDPVWIVVESLRDLAITERIHTNELVPKRERGARFFVPKAPRLVCLPD